MNNIMKHQNIEPIYYKTAQSLMPLLMRGLLILLILADITFAQSSSPPKRNIKGYVKDAESGEALPYANIIVKETHLGAAANTDGYFVILNIPTGICTLQVSYIGYITREIAVKNIEGEPNLILNSLLLSGRQMTFKERFAAILSLFNCSLEMRACN